MCPQDDLFSTQATSQYLLRPLADRMRPQTLGDFYGQSHILGKGKPLRLALETGQPHSMILWGPPGTGKTTLARMMAQHVDAEFLSISAVLSGVKDIRAATQQAQQLQREQGRASVLFVDEVHRFNKSQQDAFLPYIEDGTVIFVGATTENPSFELNNALLSRARVYVLKSLDSEAINEILQRALEDSGRGLAEKNIQLDAKLQLMIAEQADGDARRALNLLEICADLADGNHISYEIVEQVLSGTTRRFDKQGEVFYDQISALHKSVRGSNPDGALYWMARMFDAGCDPLYVARRVVRMASEDIGNADPRALEIALNAWDVQQRLGSPEGELAIAHAVVYLACAAKSNAVYQAYNQAMQDAKNSGSLEVPLHLRNAPTALIGELGYGQHYRYAHDEPDGYAAGENYLPDELKDRVYYTPVERGLESKIKQRLEYLRDLDEQYNIQQGNNQQNPKQ